MTKTGDKYVFCVCELLPQMPKHYFNSHWWKDYQINSLLQDAQTLLQYYQIIAHRRLSPIAIKLLQLFAALKTVLAKLWRGRGILLCDPGYDL